jgi:VWFA-related protein
MQVADNNEPDIPHADVSTAQTDGGSYRVDVVVIDQVGQPMNWLHPGDFTLNDNKEERPLVGFSAVDQTVMKTEDLRDSSQPPKISVEPAEVVLVIDAVNLSPAQVKFVRAQAEKYLRANDGRLTALTRFALFTGAGLQLLSDTTLNGKELADQLSTGLLLPQVQASIAAPVNAAERFQLSVKNFKMLVTNERKRPGRKLVFWMGPGWPESPSSASSSTEFDKSSAFDAIVTVENGLRDARMRVFNLRISSEDENSSFAYQNYLKGVRNKEEADAANLTLQVLAARSGGRVTVPSSDVAGEIERSVAEESTYYTLRFKPRISGRHLAYHDLEVQIGQPGAVARVISGYYEAP